MLEAAGKDANREKESVQSDTKPSASAVVPESFHDLKVAEHERVVEFVQEHPYRVSTRAERLFPRRSRPQ